jgi:dolichol-phosphate mannosyltransferase
MTKSDQQPHSDKSLGSGLAIIIATYNEIDNLPDLIGQLAGLLPNATILVIDDNSPDGTGQWCDDNANRFPSMHCVHRKGKLGLGSATIAGFAWASERNYPLVATMDADFSHDPATMPHLLKKLSERSDDRVAVVIGSRYVAGGSIEGWPLFRRIASKAVNGFARFWLGLKSRDNSGAFRIYRTNALETIGLTSIGSESYSYLEEVLYRLEQAGFQSIEHPITFKDREQGVTKTDWKLGLRVFWEIFRMRNSAAQTVRHNPQHTQPPQNPE